MVTEDLRGFRTTSSGIWCNSCGGSLLDIGLGELIVSPTDSSSRGGEMYSKELDLFLNEESTLPYRSKDPLSVRLMGGDELRGDGDSSGDGS